MSDRGLIVFDPRVDAKYYALCFSTEPPSEGKFPPGSVKFCIGLQPLEKAGTWHAKSTWYINDRRRLLKRYPVQDLLEEAPAARLSAVWRKKGVLEKPASLEAVMGETEARRVVGELEARTGLGGYIRSASPGIGWVRAESIPPEKAPVPLEVDF